MRGFLCRARNLGGPGTSCREALVEETTGVAISGTRTFGNWEGLFHCDGGFLFVPADATAALN
jgi:hypothetical protein